jgi:hypothetical protein
MPNGGLGWLAVAGWALTLSAGCATDIATASQSVNFNPNPQFMVGYSQAVNSLQFRLVVIPLSERPCILFCFGIGD